jgi:hypothetical protein
MGPMRGRKRLKRLIGIGPPMARQWFCGKPLRLGCLEGGHRVLLRTAGSTVQFLARRRPLGATASAEEVKKTVPFSHPAYV